MPEADRKDAIAEDETLARGASVPEPRGRLFLATFTLLFIELVYIRYLGTELPTVGFFKNLILIACFLGFGVGLGSGIARERALGLFVWAALGPPLLVRIATLIGLDRAPYSGFGDEAILLGGQSVAAAISGLALSFVVVVLPMIFLGALVGCYFNLFQNSLRAYGWDILGSLAGTAAFALLCSFSLPPEAWFAAGVALVIVLLVSERALIGRARVARYALIALVPIVLSSSLFGGESIWTPYYKLSVFPMSYSDGEVTGHGLRVNNTWFQRSFDVSLLDRAEEVEEEAHAARRLRFVAPFLFAEPERVLVLGSGLGNDTASALFHGAESVHAVDIDPMVSTLSERYHPNQPYSDERVEMIVDDARHFLTISDERFDLILFGVLEARSLFSQFANLRLDNYVYTREAMAQAKAHLAPGGVLWLNMWVPKLWVLEKFKRLLTELFGDSLVVLRGTGSNHFSFVGCVDCDFSRLDEVLARAGAVERLGPLAPTQERVTIPTDDWPYIFYRASTLPTPYLLLLATLIGIALVPLRLTFKELFHLDWGFFFLGAAFLLVETSAVTRMALVAGTTWVVNSAVFAGILIFVYLSNQMVLRFELRAWKPAFAGLGAALLLAWVFPFASLLALPNTAAIAAGAAVLTLPLFFSGVVFSIFFRDAAVASRALASNLFGAILGGLAEYTSMLWGNRSMTLVAFALYAIAFFAFRSRRS
jgi:spermidine synthase